MRRVPSIDTKPFELFLDLDGVFADFERRVQHLSGHKSHELKGLGKGLWKIVMADKQFFASLEFMPDAEYLWAYAKQYNPTFLTGAPPGERFQEQKREWVAKKFGPQYLTIVLPKKDKQLYSGPNKMLIDDTPINVSQWSEKGGLGVLYKGDVWDTISHIEGLRCGYPA